METGSPGKRPVLPKRARLLVTAGMGMLALLLFGPRLVDIYVDWLWFGEVGFRSVWITVLLTRLAIVAAVALVVAGIVLAALLLAYRSRPFFVPDEPQRDPVAPLRSAVMRRPRLFGWGIAVTLGVVCGLIASFDWVKVQLFVHGGTFGIVDPEFGGAPPQRGSRCRRICAPSSSKGCGAETRPRQSRSWNRRSPALPAQASAGRPSRHPGGSSGVDECVVDAAAVVDALAGKGASAIVLRGLLKESISNAPHLLDAEVGHALRRAVLSDEISEEQARAALDALPYLIDNRYPHSPRLIEYTWQLRHNVTFYDALYVALATALDVPLLTGDSRLAAAPGLPCEIKLVR